MNTLQLDLLYPATVRNQFMPSPSASSPMRVPIHQTTDVFGHFRQETTDHTIDMAIIRYLRDQQKLLEFFTDSLESLE